MGILDLKRGALENGLCGEYTAKWDKAQSKRDLADIGLDINGMRFVSATSAKNTWGLSPKYITENFSDFINGKYIRKKDGYTSEVYVQYHGDITVRSTAIMIIQCDCEVFIPRNHIAEIYVTCESHIQIHAEGICTVFKFDESTIKYNGTGSVHIHSLQGWN